jgi:electron transfer flavoprotein alpha subunit
MGGILVAAEYLLGDLSDITFEMLGVGRKIAQALGEPLEVLLLGADVKPLASRLGAANTVLVAEEPKWEFPFVTELARPLSQVAEARGSTLILVGGTNLSLGVGARLASILGRGFVNFCTNFRHDGSSLVFTSRLFGGKILAETKLPQNSGVVSVYPGSFPADDGHSDKAPSIQILDLPLDPPKAIFRSFIEPEAGDVDITKQDILVSVGRGIQSKENLELAEELAQILGGAVSASRPVVDQGWLPLSRQVGKSGMSVKPRLYLALGISGAPEHYEGMKNSKTVVAVNKDPHAPIFDVAQYGVCGDLFDIVPALQDAIKLRKQERVG